jgi:glycosyltransferase involved in cell wall biosynthesis
VSPEKTLLLPLPPPRNSAPVPKPDLWSHAKPTDKKVLYAGRLIDIKGVHILLEALTKYLPKEKVSLLLIGANGPADYQERIRSMVEKDPRILLIPTQQEPTVMAAIAAADAVVVPSLWPETGPYAVLEALYMKKYIVGANRAGIAERLNGINGGCLYDPHNACELAEALQRALSQERSGRQNFSIQSYESSYESAVSKLIAAASSTGPSIGEADRLNG